MAIPIPFAQGFYVSESLPISSQECVNFYPSPPQTTTITDMALFGTPGLVEKTAAEDKEFNRGADVLEEILYEVNGNNLYRIDRTFDGFGNALFDAVAVNDSVPIPGDQRVITAENGNELCIVVPESDDQFNAWIFTEDNGLIQISDSDFDGPVSSVVYIDGFFLFTKKDGNKFFISNLRQGLVYLATDFADAEVDSDPIRGAFVLNSQLYIYGSKTIEPFQNVGGSGFPFQRIQGGVLQKGLLATSSLTEVNTQMVWIGSGKNEQPAIWSSSGGQPTKLSTSAIDNQLRQFSDTDVSNSFALEYSQGGNFFVAFTIPNEVTFTYNLTSGLWFTQESNNNGTPIPWRVASIQQAYGELFVGDSISPKIGIIDKEAHVEYDDVEFKRRFSLPPVGNGGLALFSDSVEVLAETGTATQTGQGSDPQLSMSFSDDGGRTFNNPMARSMGKIGEYTKRIIWNRLGRSARERAYRFEISDPIKPVILKVELNTDG